MIKPEETEIIGDRLKSGDGVVGDEGCKRYQRYTEQDYLVKTWQRLEWLRKKYPH